MLADQMIARVEYMHARSFLHRDVKPENFLMGTASLILFTPSLLALFVSLIGSLSAAGLDSKANIVHVIDFGLAKRYRNPHTHQHILSKDQKSLTGTARYAVPARSLYGQLPIA